LAIVWAAALVAGAPGTGSKHKISITFNYDFTQTPVRRAKTANLRGAVQSVRHLGGSDEEQKIDVVPTTPGANGVVKGITVKTLVLLFEPGKHLLAVTAQMSKGDESDPSKCTIGVEMP
jgi:hypothetical protein